MTNDAEVIMKRTFGSRLDSPLNGGRRSRGCLPIPTAREVRHDQGDRCRTGTSRFFDNRGREGKMLRLVFRDCFMLRSARKAVLLASLDSPLTNYIKSRVRYIRRRIKFQLRANVPVGNRKSSREVCQWLSKRLLPFLHTSANSDWLSVEPFEVSTPFLPSETANLHHADVRARPGLARYRSRDGSSSVGVGVHHLQHERLSRVGGGRRFQL